MLASSRSLHSTLVLLCLLMNRINYYHEIDNLCVSIGTWKHARGKVNSVKTKMLTVTIAQFGNPVRLSVPQTACRLISKEELAREEAETEEEQLRSFKVLLLPLAFMLGTMYV